MKKIFALFILAAMIAISCNDDDNNQNNNGIEHPYTDSVVGTWRTIGLIADGQPVDLSCSVPNPAEDNYRFDFLADGTFNLYHNCDFDPEPAIIASGTYSTTGNVLRMTLDGQEGRAHMIDYLNQGELHFRFNIGSSGLFYGYTFIVQPGL